MNWLKRRDHGVDQRALPESAPGLPQTSHAELHESQRLADTPNPDYLRSRQKLYRQLIQRLDLPTLHVLDLQTLRAELRRLIAQMLQETPYPLNQQELESVAVDVEHEVLGLGPLERLLADPTVSDILVNRPDQVYVERSGRLELTPARFDDHGHILRVIERIVSKMGRRIDESSPMVDARLSDGSRVNAIIPPLAVDGPVLSIRKFPGRPLTVDDLLKAGSLTPEMAHLLAAMVRAKLNILIAGGTGTGKTTTLNVLSAFIPAHERIVTIEDAAELQLQQPHVIRLETRPPNAESRGEVTQRALVRNALRMRPDRIILGEVRGEETFDMLQAMNTGHEGSMATVHANSPRDALMRLENMMALASVPMDSRAVRQQMASALAAVVQIQRYSDGRRRVVSLCEITGMEGDVVTTQEIFRFERSGVNAQGVVLGHFRATGIRPQFHDRLEAYGQTVPADIYDPTRIYQTGPSGHFESGTH